MYDESLPEAVGRMLITRGCTIAIAESCSGGLVSHMMTDVSGISQIFLGGITAYSNSAKVKFLRVPTEVIENYGAVSKECALCMAEGVKREFESDMGIGITGIAGPEGGTIEKPVGTVFMALSARSGSRDFSFQFLGDGRAVKMQTAQMALKMVRRYLLENDAFFQENH